jgi:hypothetical protein
MNPFDLRGPEFLFFYFLLSGFVILGVGWLRELMERGPTPQVALDDPYFFAYLRGWTADPVARVSGGSSARLEALLARIYVDEPLRASFLAAPEEFARRHTLSPEDAGAVASIDRTDLALAARSFARKRQLKRSRTH